MKIIDGKALAASMREKLKEKVATFGEPITLAVVLAGENPASQVYGESVRGNRNQIDYAFVARKLHAGRIGRRA